MALELVNGSRADKPGRIPPGVLVHPLSTTAPPEVPQPMADDYDFRVPVPARQQKVFTMVELQFDNLVSARPLVVSVDYSGGCYEVVHEDLGVFGRGASTSEAFEDFVESLVADYRVYAEESDSKLDASGLALANMYRSMFRRSDV